MNKLLVSPSPHLHSNWSVKRAMYTVLVALLPAYVVAICHFGLGAIIVSLTAMASCVLTEFVIERFILKRTASITNGSALLTGLLLAFNLPSNLPWWMVVIGSIVAIGIGKMAFGGLGNNPFNPALVGRVFLLISFPQAMTTWPRPLGWATSYLDAETAATPLALMKHHLSNMPNHFDLLVGHIGGSMGEISAIALLVGFIILLLTRTITWHIPISILASVAVFAGILHAINPAAYPDVLSQLLTGGLLLGAIFMATDYVSSPMSKSGQLVYGIFIGVMTVLIRYYGSYPEGMSFAILLGNAITPILNKYLTPKRFGGK